MLDTPSLDERKIHFKHGGLVYFEFCIQDVSICKFVNTSLLSASEVDSNMTTP